MRFSYRFRMRRPEQCMATVAQARLPQAVVEGSVTAPAAPAPAVSSRLWQLAAVAAVSGVLLYLLALSQAQVQEIRELRSKLAETAVCKAAADRRADRLQRAVLELKRGASRAPHVSGGLAPSKAKRSMWFWVGLGSLAGLLTGTLLFSAGSQVTALKRALRRMVAANGTCPICLDEHPDIFVLIPCAHFVCEPCFQEHAFLLCGAWVSVLPRCH
mmetsp:Transcript_118534/g.271947  ORF Transcript_118534/g.271947 Transcript_118534/m.271947 type:complete len:215 (-) Transcript_118534:29-673(-)